MSHHLQIDILNFFLSVIMKNHTNLSIISNRFQFSIILINLLSHSNIETAKIILKILSYICTIIHLGKINIMSEEFRCLSILMKESQSGVWREIVTTLHELLIYDFDVFQPLFLEADIYLALQMKFLSLLSLDSKKLEINELNEKTQHLNYLIKLLQMLLKNNNSLIGSFIDIGHFEILLGNIQYHKKTLKPFILFFLDEEVKNMNLQPYLDFLMKKIEKITDFNDYDNFFTFSSLMMQTLIVCVSKKVFREAILKRFGFFNKFFDSLSFLKTFHPIFVWNDQKQKNLIKGLVFLKKILHNNESGFFRRHFKRKNLFYELIEKLTKIIDFCPENTELILLRLLDLAIIPYTSLPYNKPERKCQKKLKKKDINQKTWNYFRSDGLFVWLPEIIKSITELFLIKCNMEIQINFFHVIYNLLKSQINCKYINKICLLDSITILNSKMFDSPKNELSDIFVNILFKVCESIFTKNLAQNFCFILKKNIQVFLNFVFIIFFF